MKILRIFVLSVFTFSTLLGQSSKLSHIPPTKNIFIDLDILTCKDDCLEELLTNGEIFTFISKYKQTDDANLQARFYMYKSLFRLSFDEELSIRVALLVPQKSIRRYAITTVNSVIAYMLSKEHNFELKVFNSIDEERDSLLNALHLIKEENFQYVIAPLTQNGADVVIENAKNLLVYIPTIHQSNYQNTSSNVIFGGIDYRSQITELLKLSNQKIAIFSDGSQMGDELGQLIEAQDPHVIYSEIVNNSKTDFKKMLKTNTRLDNSSIFLNTPLVKTSLLASQFRFYERQPYSILSTQINYNPLLLTLTQYEDRENFYIANSIGSGATKIEETNTLFGHNIVYDWVNYSTSVGIDYIYSFYLSPSSPREFHEEIIDNQVHYNISIIKPTRYKFEKVSF